MTWFRVFLWPFSLIYGLIMHIRNKLFDWQILSSAEYPIPVISIGNLSTGGTGKTPHTEYLINLLQKHKNIAVLSRGYKRKTKGFQLASETSSADDVGDEPLQIKRKFPDVLVAVHEKRRKGIDRILKDHPNINTIILDDAFQHRYVKPGLNLLLTEYYKPFFNNFLLPCGNLRESTSGIRRAHAIIVTKTPAVFSPLEKRFFLQKLKPYRPSNIFFSGLRYGKPVPVWQSVKKNTTGRFKTIYLLTGIANPDALEQYLQGQCEDLHLYTYHDHHRFSLRELMKLRNHFIADISHSKAIITTEKDAMRLQTDEARKLFDGIPTFYIPIHVRFQDHGKDDFDSFVLNYLDQSKPAPQV